MADPDMTCMHVNLWVHHMDIDKLFDFITERIPEPPDYWISREACPSTITGGYAEINVSYNTYLMIRRVKEHGHF